MAKLSDDYIHNLLALLGGFEDNGSRHTICFTPSWPIARIKVRRLSYYTVNRKR